MDEYDFDDFDEEPGRTPDKALIIILLVALAIAISPYYFS